MKDSLDPKGFRRALGKISPKKKGGKIITSMSLDGLNFRALKAVAEAEGVSQSQLTDLAIEMLLTSLAAGDLDGLLESRKEVSKTPRWKWKLEAGVDKSVLALLIERRGLTQLTSLL